MNYIWGMAIAIVYLFGPGMDRDFLHPKGKCPFKGGVIRKLTQPKGIIIGTEESTVDISGNDSIVLSAADGRVMEVIGLQYTSYLTIKVDTTIYTYIDIDRPLVQEGQVVKAGQEIAIARGKRIAFFVSNYHNKIFRNPDAYVDCTCELIKLTQ